MKQDILEKLDGYIKDKERLEEVTAKGIAKGVGKAAAAVGLAATSFAIPTLGIALAAGLGAGAIAVRIAEIASKKPQLTKDIKQEYIIKNKDTIAKDLYNAFINEPEFVLSLIGKGSVLENIEDKNIKQDLSQLFFVLLTLHGQNVSIPFLKKGATTLLRSKDPYVIRGAKEGEKMIKAMTS